MRTRRRLFAICFAALSLSLSAQSTSKILATVNGENIREEEVGRAAAADLATLEAQKSANARTYDRDKLSIMNQALAALVADKLIAAAAARDKTTTEQITFAEIESNVAIPTADEVEAFYQANKERIALPHDQALQPLKQYLIDQQRKRYRDGLVYALKKQFPVKIFLDPVRTEVATAGFPSHGPDAAPVTIVEFSDFECPFCGRLHPTLKAIEKSYPDKVRLVYRQFPLTSLHPRAQKAAEASLCAHDQKRFWDFHDSLFADQAHLTIDDLKKRAGEMKLDTSAFNACLDSGAKSAAVEKDAEAGRAAGVSGTPAMFINGRFMNGNLPYADIREVIEDELQRQSSKDSTR